MYAAAVGWMVRWRRVVVPAYLGVCALVLWQVGGRLGTELFPQIDSGVFVLRFRPAPAASHNGGTAVWSGDRVTRDAEGLLHFAGRRDAMIKSAGNRISPQEIEDAALASGQVAEAVALGVPDAALGQAIHLVVRGTGDEEALRAALRRDLPNFMQPQAIRWLERMPLNPNGKIDRAALQENVTS